ncbi:MAG: anti-sigma factor [Hyphomicrobiales bacterium]|nr:MAG: anti-sigma factor [Hyphomicrobiales bacterium]
MQCERAREFVSRGLDGELDEAEKDALGAHLSGCPACAEMARDLARMSRDVRALGREPAPVHVKTRLLDAIRKADAEAPAVAGTWSSRQVSMPRLAAAVVIACLVSSGLTLWLLNTREAGARLEHDIVTAHVRSLLESPIQVASADTHTVKPWFAGRVDVSPVVKDLASDGFALAGGRLDYVDGKRVAVVVYRQRQHVINVFTWAATTARPPHATTRNGYNLLTWSANGVVYCAISDLNLGEMERLRSLL